MRPPRSFLLAQGTVSLSSQHTESLYELPIQRSYTQPTKILLVWENDHNMISWAYDIDFERFKFLWIQVSELYVLALVSSTFEHVEFWALY